MSRVSNTILSLENITINESENELEVRGAGAAGLIIKKVKGVKYIFEDKTARVEGPAALAGTAIRLLQSAIMGVIKPFERSIIVHGSGTKVTIDHGANCLVMEVGYSHPVRVPFAKEVKVTAKEGTTNTIIVRSMDKRALGDFCATVKKVRKNNVYGHFYIMIEGEQLVFKKRGLNG